MTGGLHFTPEQIRSLPLAMQIQIGLEIAAQLIQAPPVAGKEEKDGYNIGKRGSERASVPIQCLGEVPGEKEMPSMRVESGSGKREDGPAIWHSTQ